MALNADNKTANFGAIGNLFPKISPQIKQLAKGLGGALAIGGGADVASRAITGEELSAPMQLAALGLGGAAGMRRLGPQVAKVAPSLMMQGAGLQLADAGMKHYQGFSSLDPKSVQAKVNQEVANKARSFTDDFIKRPEIQNIMNSLRVRPEVTNRGFQFSNLHRSPDEGVSRAVQLARAYLDRRARPQTLAGE